MGVALFLLLTTAAVARAFEDVEVTVDIWTSDTGRAYVGVRAAAQWATPAQSGATARTEYYSRWELVRIDHPLVRVYWVTILRSADDAIVGITVPIPVFLPATTPGIELEPLASADLSLFLAVAVEPATAPAGSERTVSAALTGEWVNALRGYLAAHVDPDSLRISGWTVDFGDGSVEQHPPDPVNPFALSVPHTYADAGAFTAIVTAHVAGEAYAAFFAPGGVPAERVEPFSLDISNSAGGIGALAITDTDPVVTVGAAPSSPAGPIPVGPPADGSTALWWPRGLLAELHPRAIVVSEGTMISGGVVLGMGSTRLVGYRYVAGTNDASTATPSGRYAAGEPIRIQWVTPLPGDASYPVRLELELETTYPDGTVRATTAAGTVEVTVVYSAVGGS